MLQDWACLTEEKIDFIVHFLPKEGEDGIVYSWL